MKLNRVAWFLALGILVLVLGVMIAPVVTAAAPAGVSTDWTAANPHPGTVSDVVAPYPHLTLQPGTVADVVAPYPH